MASHDHTPVKDQPASPPAGSAPAWAPWPTSLLSAGALPRLGAALALVVLLWLAVGWATGGGA